MIETKDVFDNIVVTRKRMIQEFLKAASMAAISRHIEVSMDALKRHCAYEVDKNKKTSYGFTHPYPQFIALTNNVAKNNAIDYSQIIATISHESLHLVVGMNEGYTTNVAMDRTYHNKKSLLKRLQYEGYLGGQY